MSVPLFQSHKPDLGEALGLAFRDHPRYRGCVGHWIMADGGGLTVLDISGNNAHGTRQNAPAWVTGQFGSALDFDGDNQYLSLPTVSAYQRVNVGDFSVTCWAYPRDTETSRQRVMHGTEPAGHWNLTWNGNDNDYFLFQADANSNRAATDIVSANAWYHVIGVYQVSGDIVTIYLNGKSFTSPGAGTYGGHTSNAFFVGTRATTSPDSDFFDGRVDDVRYYNRALSSWEAQSLFYDPFLEFDEAAQIQRRRFFFLGETGAAAATSLPIFRRSSQRALLVR